MTYFKRLITVFVSAGALCALLLLGLYQISGAQTAVAAAPASPFGEPISQTVYLPALLTPSQQCYFAETDDAVVIEIEAVSPVDHWELRSDTPGYTGSGYYVWTGPQQLGTPGVAILSYPISVTQSATYRLNIRNSHPDFPSDFNDVWVHLDDGPWLKGFSNVINQWTYDFHWDFGGGNITWADFDNVTPGLHTLELSARSVGFKLDRLVFSANGMGQLDDWPQSPCVVP